MMEYLERSDFFKCEIAQGAFYCFPSYNLNVPSLDLSQSLLQEAHVATVPGSAFGTCGEGHLRLSYAADLKDIRKAFERMEVFFKKHH